MIALFGLLNCLGFSLGKDIRWVSSQPNAAILNDAQNWNSKTNPTAQDDVVIDISGYSKEKPFVLNMNAAVSMQSLTLNGFVQFVIEWPLTISNKFQVGSKSSVVLSSSVAPGISGSLTVV